MPDRNLGWKGAYNARDLGGLPTVDGELTRTGAIVRSDSLQDLEAQGWEEVEAYGVRTVVDLRNESEIEPDATRRGPRVLGRLGKRSPVRDAALLWPPPRTLPRAERGSRSRHRDGAAGWGRLPLPGGAVTVPARSRCWSWPWSGST